MFLAHTLLRIFQDDGGGAAAAVGGLFSFLCFTVVFLAVIAGMWRVFTKAGQPGWAAIVPIYNIYVLTQIVGREAWWVVVVLLISPAFIILAIDLAKSFGKGAGYGIGLFLLGPIFFPMLGFGDAEYQGPSANAGAAM